MQDWGGSWVAITVLGVAVLGCALAYGMSVWRKRRSRSANVARDAATDRLYGKQ